MFSTLLSRALGVALLTLLIGNRVHGAELTPYVPNDIACPPNSFPSFTHNSYAYIAPLHKFNNLTKSFFNIEWYGGIPVTNTTGTDNVPGATRTGPFGGATYNETLTFYRKRSDLFTWSYIGKGLTFTLPPYPTITSYGYAETFLFQSICNGQATYIEVLTFSCSNNQVNNYNLWYTFHNEVFPAMASSLGAPVLAGDCPVN
ncbi:hypothetical protein MVEN_02265700 [Mycena venus]|uniref:Uncharacterized protein n=1 Tax=Mycena venus TaxID=2733690 RepID=A0A8H6X6Z7_9AGAR|nr:hypothetical protein MVEN_02265700 [Mycena venus]